MPIDIKADLRKQIESLPKTDTDTRTAQLLRTALVEIISRERIIRELIEAIARHTDSEMKGVSKLAAVIAEIGEKIGDCLG